LYEKTSQNSRVSKIIYMKFYNILGPLHKAGCCCTVWWWWRRRWR